LRHALHASVTVAKSRDFGLIQIKMLLPNFGMMGCNAVTKEINRDHPATYV
jgi:hypothetical protein